MTILQSLDRYYERMAARGEAEPPGFSREKIGFAIELSPDGVPVAVIDLRAASGKKLVPQLLSVPAAVKRTAGILPNLLWDKSAYVLGRTAGEGKRTAQEHAAFKATHLDLLEGESDPSLLAVRRFLESWMPERFDAPPFHADMLDANIVFRLQGETRFVHEREAARARLGARLGGEGRRVACLVSGRPGIAQRLHPSIKGVNGAQSSGAALVSFNLDAFTSYGKEQGDNAPTSEEAAFRYGAALNGMLERSSRNRLARGIGDATVVFWADTSAIADEAAAQAAENWFAVMIDPPDDASEAKKVRDRLEDLVQGRPIDSLDELKEKKIRFHVLGLAPNAARLSVRYWLSDEFGTFVHRLAEHYRDLAIEPTPWGERPPSIAWLLMKTTAMQEKFDNIPPLLAGEVTRAVLEGTRYPRSLLANAIMRLRAGGDPATGWHAAIIRAVLAREFRVRRPDPHAPASHDRAKEELPVSLQRENSDPAYQLGRLFAAYETAQRMALGKVNATIRDRYFGAASATPARVFPILMRGVQNHLGKLRKGGKGAWLEREIEEITNRLEDYLPRSLPLEAQGRFVLGYYHQRKGQFTKPEAEAELASTDAEDHDNDE
ncbi:CRISPR-associated protein Csd1 [Angulomicrobium tetraedrale]|uniref:CRISPR-associated protein Csd1 n=1 Tax=Ancylobacter tetraedralis TaxID=217068 RepID=A0A839ZFU5_9HYPH|nr:type I-C CRISPR-associated protein Cas8c/Csd1 [Ancylobacter tetraedralis]MBB3773644.1 CRISPR-associated protein Csd1 [Ancylobacter tetraedralis]